MDAASVCSADQVTGLMLPTMPKSMKPTRPSGSARRLPARMPQACSVGRCVGTWGVQMYG
eukprot:362077-Chlamydomonas_euryale.AAC.2